MPSLSCLDVSLFFCAGIAVGHVYFFLEDVFPNQPGGSRWLRTPSFLCVRKCFFVLLCNTMRHDNQEFVSALVSYPLPILTLLLSAVKCCLTHQRKIRTTTPSPRSAPEGFPGAKASAWGVRLPAPPLRAHLHGLLLVFSCAVRKDRDSIRSS